MGFKTVISTPIFGQDNISTHGYWTTNPYQITSSLGDMDDYERLQKELFKRGMGFVADGAFVNEGLEGIHLSDIFKYGKNSPYYNWFEMHGDPNEPITVGVLPMDKKAADNYDIRIVNSPLVWSVNAKGFASEINGFKNTAYNPDKPTYVQLYDRRLTSVDQLERQELIRSYDIKNPKEKNAIKDYMDSVQPYAFEVSPDEVISKFKEPLGENEEFKEHLKNWKNFLSAEASEDKRVTLWVGNKDIAKLKFMITEKKLNDIRKAAPSPEAGERKVKQIKEGINQVQDSIINIGKYWTKKTYDLLTLHTAEILAGARTVDEFKQKIRENANKLPPQIAYLADKDDKTIENLFEGNYNYDNFPKIFDELIDGLKAFPLESIEFSPEVTSILASPDFKKEAGHDIYDSQISDKAMDIMIELSDATGIKLVQANQLTEEGKAVFSLISDDIAKYLIVKSLVPTCDQDDHRDVPKLREITLNYLKISQGSHSQAAEELSMRISKGLEKISENDLKSYAKTFLLQSSREQLPNQSLFQNLSWINLSQD
jgi:hypothetical protein